MQLNMPSNLMEQIAQLSPERRALLERKLKEKAQGASSPTNPIRHSERAAAPLSFAQQRFWFFEQLEPGCPVYNEWTATRLHGPLDRAVLEQSIQELVRRHAALRTTFTLQDGQPVQVIAPTGAVPLTVHDLQHLSITAREIEVERLAQAATQQPFDLTQGPLLRTTLFQLGTQEAILLLTFHHIVTDAWSATVFYRELGTLYAAFAQQQPSPLPELPVHYTDFTLWQREWAQSPAVARQLAYWQKQLADLSPLQLPLDRPRPHKQSYRGAQRAIPFSAPLTQALQRLSQQAGASLFMTLLAAFQTLLYRYTGQEDIVVGAPIANRNRPEIEGLIGCFTNTLVLRSDLAGNPSFRTLVGRVRATVLDALANQELPFEKLVEELQPERDLGSTPLFQVLFVYNNTALDFDRFGTVRATPVDFTSTVARFDLTLSVMELATGLQVALTYNTDLFAATTIDRMAGHLQTLLAGIVADPDQPIANLPLLTAPERHQLLVEWNDTATAYPKNKCLHHLFEEQVARTPDAVALIDAEQHLTYQAVNMHANQLAQHLQMLGVGPEVPVGICVERSVAMVVGLLGILKAGGAYLPLDPAYPSERVAFMLADGEPLVLLTQESLLATLPPSAAQLICLDSDWQAIAQQPTTNPSSGVTAGNLAYILYTSGSTGRPKGVEIEHHSPVALIDWSREVFTPAEIAGTLASTSICFDLSVFELFVPLSRGGTAILAQNALQLPTLPAAAAVTLVNTVPSAMLELVRNQALPVNVRVVNLAGEPLKNALVQQIYQQAQVQRVFNLYGPSEDTTYSTYTLVQKGATTEPTIGRPLANTRLYILDRHDQPVPIGVIGELYIGGAGLARGYRNRPELTQEKFLAMRDSGQRSENSRERSEDSGQRAEESGQTNDEQEESLAASHRLYRTGDLARYRVDGEVEFLGRRDNQVKLRGFRIELGEIEAALSQHALVQEAVVVVREEQAGAGAAGPRLVAYVTTKGMSSAVLETALAEHLRRRLPHYMVPAVYVQLDALPLTPNGKVDRRALPTPDVGARPRSETFVPPNTPTESQVATIWGDLLGLTQPSIRDDFFAVGGHSLLATQVISRCRESFQIDIPLLSLFEERTIAGLANRIEELQLTQALQQQVTIATEAREEILL
ncbi:MAG: amino acid adenylation domain-containing protein [Caldilineaceae bacterium]|nr:amino acid adenylation domain-containing protein [Caldilineaceae bacterium]